MSDKEFVQLAEQGYLVMEGLFKVEELSALHSEVKGLQDKRLLTPAGIGKLAQASTLRGDGIKWVDNRSEDAAERLLISRLNTLMKELNQALFLSLDEVEAHFACYPPGAHYARHVDRFSNDDARVLSLVIYLNPDWGEADGGELMLYSHKEFKLKLTPLAGKAILFRSELFPHEVLPAKRERFSIAAWFRRRAVLTPIL